MLNLISDEEMAVLFEVQRLPFVLEPFAEIANRLGMEENKVIDICKDLLNRGAIRRFGISINHRRIGIKANLMVVANVPEDKIDVVGKKIANIDEITHCYYRVGWDYNLFFMMHSYSKEKVVKRASKIIENLGITNYKYMFSTREFKKTSFEVPKPIDILKTYQNYEKLIANPYQLPVVLNLAGPVVIFGGGKVGKRKVEYVSKFTKDIIVVAKDSLELPGFVKLHLFDLSTENFSQFIPNGTALVIATLSDAQINVGISEYCMTQKILVNVVDNPAISTIIFPALSKKGDLNIAISTGGRCPYLSKKIREYMDLLNEDWASWLEILAPIRKNLVGIQDKNRILSKIYKNPEIDMYILKQQLDKAKIKAEDIYNVFSKH